jgi:uncharacterized membrane protein
MDSKVKLLGHPVHQMLIVFPLGLLSTSVLFDIISLVRHAPRWSEVAFYMASAGIIGGLLAAVPGWLDWWAIPRRTRAKQIGLLHGIGNVIVVALFIVSWLLRYHDPAAPPTLAIVAALLGVALALVTGWLGGELVDRLGVGVDDGAHLNAPSSLSTQPVRGSARPGDRRAYPSAAYSGVERRAVGATR